ncbi:MAG: eukaryotic-like serine/threonine-protein kinase [Solirubrobacteraceae bacterium]|nr:eukaryotic-like serine/threonine-protein kinase [Solirubrobacteraceae bacterium]
MAASFSSSTEADLAPGTEVAGFTVERVLGHGPRGTVYEAMQPGLRRRVALKVYRPDPALAERFAALRWPEHPHVASLYAAGTCEHGFFTATRLVRGPTLRQLLAREPRDEGHAARLCDDVGRALAAAHGAGIVHGAVHGANVLVDGDGRALLTDFVPAAGDARAASDVRALARLRALCATGGGARARAARRVRLGGAVAALLVAGAGAAALVAGRSAATPEAVAPPAAGMRALGSSLSAAAVRSVACDGEPATGAALPCVLMQTRLPGRTVVMPADGVIRGWLVRAAHGELALHVLRPRAGRFVVVGSSPYQHVGDAAVHRLAAQLAVRRGDRVGVELVPGAMVGIARGGRGAATERFVAPRLRAPLTPTSGLPRFDHEILVRVDYVAGGRLASGVLTGRAAARAPTGRVLVRHDVEAARRVRTVALVSLPDRVALDLLAGSRRLMRVTILSADPRGHPVQMDINGVPRAEVIWRNRDGALVIRSYRVGARRLSTP